MVSERLDGECGIRSGCLAKVECICNSFFESPGYIFPGLVDYMAVLTRHV